MRLERTRRIGLKIWYTIFQFHKGAIRTLDSMIKTNILDAFQFHKGAIRTTGVGAFLLSPEISIP